MKKAVKDEWATAAMTDDQMVAELLLRLKQAATAVSENLPPLQWGIRQRRSRSSRFGGGGGGIHVTSKKKDLDSARGSPKTPLSWSDGSGIRGGDSASPSVATADGFEETSRQASCSTSSGSRSKILPPPCFSGLTSVGDYGAFPKNVIRSSFSKRLKRKKLKSSLELKYEENLKERLDLQKEIASLRATLDEQNVRNQRLKRIKLDLNSGHHVKNETPVDLYRKSQGELESCRVEGNQTASSENQESFVLPDLNMVPSEE